MSFKQYLGAFLLGAAAYLYSPVLPAETVQQKVTFTGSSKNDMIEDLEGTVTATAYQEGQTLYLTLIANKCKIKKGYSKIEVGLPAESDIIEMKQTAEVEVRKEDGRGYEKKLIELHPENELVNKGITKAAESVAGEVKIPIIQGLWLDSVEKTKRERIQVWYKQMKHEGLFMEDIPFYSAKRSDKCDDNLAFARNYKFTLNVKPSIIPKAILQVCLEDPNERPATINEISIKFDEKPDLGIQTPLQISKDLEGFLINDPELKLVKYYGPKELSKILNSDIKTTYLVKYQHVSNSEEDYVIWAQILNRIDIEKTKDILKLIDERVLNQEVRKKTYGTKDNELTIFGFGLGLGEENFASYTVYPSMSSMKEYLKTGNRTMLKNTETAKKKCHEIKENLASKMQK